jgi:glycosyltransferase involved in cell wall biosynthesis
MRLKSPVGRRRFMTKPPKISVVIPAYNEERYLTAAIASLRRAADFFQRQCGETVELIVVDNNSTDRTADVARAASADQVLHNPINNIARTRNTGARAARGEWLAFCDADNQVTENMFVAIHDNLSRPGVIGGGTLVKPEKYNVTVAVYFTIWKTFTWFSRVGVGVMHCRKADFDKVGGFNEEIFAGEDVQFAYDLKKLGRATGRPRFAVRRDAAIITSMRKTEEFSFWEVTGRMLRMAVGTQRKIRDKRYCGLWYDVRRGR